MEFGRHSDRGDKLWAPSNFEFFDQTGLIAEINPILRGWVNYFAFGHSSRCFSYIRDWVQKKVRRHLARACQRRGHGWKRWSSEWLYGTLGLFKEYWVSY